MSSTCPDGHPVLPSYEWCPYCMVKLERPATDESDPAPEPEPEHTDAEPEAAPEPGRDLDDASGSEPDSAALPAADVSEGDAVRRRRLVLVGVGAALVLGIAGVLAGLGDGNDGEADGAQPVAVASTTTAPTTTTSPPATTSTSSAPPTTQPALQTVAPPAPARDEPCDPAAAPPDSGSLRCVPIRWRDPTAPHVWWPSDDPVPGELDLDWECRYWHRTRTVTATGSVHNDSDRPRAVVITVGFVDGRGSLAGTASAALAPLDPGATGRWTVSFDDPSRRVASCRSEGLGFA